MTRKLPRLPRGYRLAGFMGPAERSCRSFVATSTTSWSSPPANGSSGTGAPGSTSGGNLPRTWQEIGIGDLVVAQEGPEDGWYEAIVVECNNDMLTLRWRDYPRERRIMRHRNRLGLLYPATKPIAATGKSPKPTAAAKEVPHDWQAIDINHLVLAKADGPWGTWWEAVPAENTGDGFKLRWRDNHANVPLITRSRFELALICPNAA
jgi:hypothetical protein